MVNFLPQMAGRFRRWEPSASQTLAESIRAASHAPSLWDARDWLNEVRQTGELSVLGDIDPGVALGELVFAATAVESCVLARGGFGTASEWRVVIGHFNSAVRHALALGLPVEEANHEGLRGFWRESIGGGDLVSSELVEDPFAAAAAANAVDLSQFPVSGWPVGAHRCLGAGHLAMIGRNGATVVASGVAHIRSAQQLQISLDEPDPPPTRQMTSWVPAEGESAVFVLGADPILTIAWSLHGLDLVDPYAWVGGVRKRPFPVWRFPSTELMVPARAEVTLGGVLRVGTNETPRPDSTGYFLETGPQFILEVSSVRRRPNTILFTDSVGRPPSNRSLLLSYPRSALLEQQLRAAGIPNIVAAWSPPQGDSHLMTLVAVRQSYGGHAVQALNVAAQAGATGPGCRYVVVVDEDIDIYDLDDVLWALLTRCDPDRDMRVITRSWSGGHDPALRPEDGGMNSRLAIDATKPWEWKERFAHTITSPAAEQAIRERWGWILNPSNEDPRRRG